jgi:hypothetical protein
MPGTTQDVTARPGITVFGAMPPTTVIRNSAKAGWRGGAW